MADKEVTTLTFTITLKEPMVVEQYDLDYLENKLRNAVDNIEGMFVAELTTNKGEV